LKKQLCITLITTVEIQWIRQRSQKLLAEFQRQLEQTIYTVTNRKAMKAQHICCNQIKRSTKPWCCKPHRFGSVIIEKKILIPNYKFVCPQPYVLLHAD